LALSCDDTKLFATFQLYWDSQDNNYYLVGGVDGRILVVNPDQIQETLAVTKAEKATKVFIFLTTHLNSTCSTDSTLGLAVVFKHSGS
jgi:hypothetical protein